jgi:hypothetical protein
MYYYVGIVSSFKTWLQVSYHQVKDDGNMNKVGRGYENNGHGQKWRKLKEN